LRNHDDDDDDDDDVGRVDSRPHKMEMRTKRVEARVERHGERRRTIEAEA
jgi:hypothetical protein